MTSPAVFPLNREGSNHKGIFDEQRTLPVSAVKPANRHTGNRPVRPVAGAGYVVLFPERVIWRIPYLKCPAILSERRRECPIVSGVPVS